MITTRLQNEIESFNFRAAAVTLMELSSFGNTYLQDVSPWKLWKEDPDSAEVKECLFTCVQIVALLSAFAKPFLPFTSDKIQRLLNAPTLENGDLKTIVEKLENGTPLLPQGHKIGEPELLFAKINDRKDSSRKELIEAQKAKLQAVLDEEKKSQREPVKSEIVYDDFSKIDIRTGTIVEAEKVKKADRLLKLKVDLGFEERTIVSGIAEHFDPAKIVGEQVLVVANLAPRKLRGIESQGMILTAENEDGKLELVQPKAAFGNGH
ncbi:MAG: methionine--tRNA ligase subunit beta, partial [Bacteroidota bacterium]